MSETADATAAREFRASKIPVWPDDELRKLGYEVFARPNDGPVMWIKRGQRIARTQAELVRLEKLKRPAKLVVMNDG